MPVGTKEITITASASNDKAWVILRNLSNGDIWHGIMQDDTVVMNMANKNIWGKDAQQWVNGNKMDVMVLGSITYGGAIHTLAVGLNDIAVTMVTDTAIDVEI